MKAKILLVAAVGLLLVLLAEAQWRAHKLQQTLAFQTASIKSLAKNHATIDLSHGVALYFIRGEVERDYVKAFEAHFREFGLTPVPTGCIITEPQRVYSDEYNRGIRDFLVRQHGKDVIEEFGVAYLSRHK